MSTLKVNTIQPVSGTPSITSSEIATLSRIMLGNSSQTWTNVTSSRATGTTYTNSTGAPIFVSVTPTPSASLIGTFSIGGTSMATIQFTPSGGGGGSPFTFIIPNGVTYLVTNASNFAISNWWELR